MHHEEPHHRHQELLYRLLLLLRGLLDPLELGSAVLLELEFEHLIFLEFGIDELNLLQLLVVNPNPHHHVLRLAILFAAGWHARAGPSFEQSHAAADVGVVLELDSGRVHVDEGAGHAAPSLAKQSLVDGPTLFFLVVHPVEADRTDFRVLLLTDGAERGEQLIDMKLNSSSKNREHSVQGRLCLQFEDFVAPELMDESHTGRQLILLD